ncbi:MAG: glycosyltransferase, partial [Chloroflexi bacterium]|nr:glycosyltransferase [Chloroflexota bacterium]
MSAPSLSDLPAPPPGKTGFPWTEASAPVLSTLPNGDPLPRVTVMTPSLNQAAYLEETIRSVLLQGYPNLEYRILDGGSTDGSVEIIQKYSPWIDAWHSRRDRGPWDAISHGWDNASGEILAYLNSDDTYLPNAISKAVTVLLANARAPAVCGGELSIDANGLVIAEHIIPQVTWHSLIALNFVPQPAIFVRKSAFDQAGGWDTQYHCSFDYELWTRLAPLGDFAIVPEPLATTRWHPGTITLTQRLKTGKEDQQIITNILASPAGRALSWRERHYVRARLNYILIGIYLDDPLKHALPL